MGDSKRDSGGVGVAKFLALAVPKDVFIDVVAERGKRKEEEEDVAVSGLRRGRVSLYIDIKKVDWTY